MYLRFLPKQPQLVLGPAGRVSGVGPRPRRSVPLPLSFRRAADGPVRARPAEVLAEVLEGEVAGRLEARLERLHDDD